MCLLSKPRRVQQKSLRKKAGCQTESNALEYSIVARIVREAGVGLLKFKPMQNGLRNIHDLIVSKPTRAEISLARREMKLNSRKKSRRVSMMCLNSSETRDVRERDQKMAGEPRDFPSYE